MSILYYESFVTQFWYYIMEDCTPIRNAAYWDIVFPISRDGIDDQLSLKWGLDIVCTPPDLEKRIRDILKKDMVVL